MRVTSKVVIQAVKMYAQSVKIRQHLGAPVLCALEAVCRSKVKITAFTSESGKVID